LAAVKARTRTNKGADSRDAGLAMAFNTIVELTEVIISSIDDIFKGKNNQDCLLVNRPDLGLVERPSASQTRHFQPQRV